EQVDTARHVCRVESAGHQHGLPHQCFGGEMHYRIDLVRGENFLDLRGFGKVRKAKHRGWRHCGAMSFLKIIQNDDAMPALQQYFRADAPNVPGAAGDQNVQRNFLHFETDPCSRQSDAKLFRICSELQNSTLSPRRGEIAFAMRVYSASEFCSLR